MPWRWQTAPATPSIPPSDPPETKQMIKLQAGYQQGGFYQYAPNVNVLALSRRSPGALVLLFSPPRSHRVVLPGAVILERVA